MASPKCISTQAHADIDMIKRDNWRGPSSPAEIREFSSNVAETTNSAILKIRKNQPTKFFMKVVQKIHATFPEIWEKHTNGNPADLVYSIFPKAVKNTENGRGVEAGIAAGHVFDVRSDTENGVVTVMNLDERTCSCNKFQDPGILCEHECAAALLADADIISLCIYER